MIEDYENTYTPTPLRHRLELEVSLEKLWVPVINSRPVYKIKKRKYD